MKVNLDYDGPLTNWLGWAAGEGEVTKSSSLREIFGKVPPCLLTSLNSQLSAMFGENEEVESDEHLQMDIVVFCLRLVFLGSGLGTVNDDQIVNWTYNLLTLSSLEIMRRDGLNRGWEATGLDTEDQIRIEGNEPEYVMKWIATERASHLRKERWTETHEKAFWGAMENAQREIIRLMGLDLNRVTIPQDKKEN